MPIYVYMIFWKKSFLTLYNKPEPLSIIAIQLISIKTAYIVCLPMKAGHLAKNLHYYWNISIVRDQAEDFFLAIFQNQEFYAPM